MACLLKRYSVRLSLPVRSVNWLAGMKVNSQPLRAQYEQLQLITLSIWALISN
jgi:hypothetical protein